jgi:hypothetical protein
MDCRRACLTIPQARPRSRGRDLNTYSEDIVFIWLSTFDQVHGEMHHVWWHILHQIEWTNLGVLPQETSMSPPILPTQLFALRVTEMVGFHLQCLQHHATMEGVLCPKWLSNNNSQPERVVIITVTSSVQNRFWIEKLAEQILFPADVTERVLNSTHGHSASVTKPARNQSSDARLFRHPSSG